MAVCPTVRRMRTKIGTTDGRSSGWEDGGRSDGARSNRWWGVGGTGGSDPSGVGSMESGSAGGGC